VRRIAAILPLVAITASGCLATKGDIRLIQDELRATRAQVGLVDTSVIRTSQQLRQQINTLSSEVIRLSDSLRLLGGRLATLQATTNGELNAMNSQIVQMQALLNQSTRTLQDTRAQLNALREQTPPSAPPAAAPAMPGDTSHRAPAGLPGSATLFLTGKQQLENGAYSTARTVFDQLLSAYPNSVEAPRAQMYVGHAFLSEGNTASADSVYVVLYTKYPQSQDAAVGLYRHGTYLWEQNKKPEARIALNRVQREYPNSDEATLAKQFLRDRDR
jgi:tol-pal system protein YbgF